MLVPATGHNRKRSGQEMDQQPKIAVLSDFIEAELARLEKVQVTERDKPDFEKLNEIFREAVGAFILNIFNKIRVS